jgi:MFS family permease
MILPLALAQFIASYAATNMNVAISAIAKDLDTTVSGVQTAITLFTLTMAALMIPGSKLTDIWGRKRCFVIGLVIYGVGGLLAALSMGLPLLIVGYSLLEGIGSALMIPPIYILITVAFPDVKSRARYFGVVSGAGGLGAATGPLIGGLITSALSWRASFGLQVLVVAAITWLAFKIADPARTGPRPHFDVTGAVLSAIGLFFVVLGLLQSRTYGFGKSREDFAIGSTVIIPKGWLSPVWIYVAIGALFLLWFFLHVRSAERRGRDVLLALRMFKNKAANLGLGTQVIQWLVMQGSFFATSVYLQEVNHYSAIKTGLLLTPATIGVLAASAGADRFARRHTQRWLIIAGFLSTVVGMILLLALVRAHSSFWTWVPGLLLFGIGVGVMLTSSVNVVQSSFPASDQGEISGLSRSLSNLGSSLGTALVGSVLVAAALPAGKPYAAAFIMLLVFALIGLVLAVLLPRQEAEKTSADEAAAVKTPGRTLSRRRGIPPAAHRSLAARRVQVVLVDGEQPVEPVGELGVRGDGERHHDRGQVRGEDRAERGRIAHRQGEQAGGGQGQQRHGAGVVRRAHALGAAARVAAGLEREQARAADDHAGAAEGAGRHGHR